MLNQKRLNKKTVNEQEAFNKTVSSKNKGKGNVKQFFAKLSRGLMLPIAILPIAGLLLGISGALSANLQKNEVAMVFSKIFAAMSDVVFANLPILFAIAVTITFSKDKGASGFCAALGYLVFCSSQLPFFQYNGDNLVSILWFHKPLNELMGTTLGMRTLETSIFGGIIVGGLTSLIYNKISQIKLPQAIDFFSGVRLVPFVLIPVMFLLALGFCLFWPWVGLGILEMGKGIQSAPYGTDGLLYGILGRSLMPFGLHHIPIVLAFQTPFGGVLTETSVIDGLSKVGLTPGDEIYDTIITSLHKFGKGNNINGDQSIWNFINQLPYNTLPTIDGVELPIFDWFHKYTGVYAGRFTQDYPTYLGLCIGIGAAIIFTAEKANRKKVGSIIGFSMLVAFLTGITEPLEFTFLFCAPFLYYLVYVPLSGFSYMFMELVNAHVGVGFARGFIDLIIYGAIPIAKGTNFWWAFIFAIIEGLFIFGIFFICIKKFDLPTPGRKDNPMTLITKKDYQARNNEVVSPNDRIMTIINLLGGKDNITDVSACATRLRVSVKQSQTINSNDFTPLGSKGSIIKDGGLQLIFGGEATIIADQINEILDSNTIIPPLNENKPTPPIPAPQTQKKTNKQWLSHPHNETTYVNAPFDGEVISLDKVPDDLFSQGLLGEGIAIKPSSYAVQSIIDGTLEDYFDTKHAYTFKSNDVDILLHIGIDTVKVKGDLFEVKVNKHDKVSKQTHIANINQHLLEKAKSSITPIVVPDLKDKQITYLAQPGSVVKQGDILFKITLKSDK